MTIMLNDRYQILDTIYRTQDKATTLYKVVDTRKSVNNLRVVKRSHGAMEEFAILKRLSHLGCVPKVYEEFEELGDKFYVMDFVFGKTLRHHMNQHRFMEITHELAKSTNWISQIANAVSEFHAVGIVHGDLKPANIFIQPDGSIKIIDFVTKGQTGSWDFQAPEQHHNGLKTPASDVYAIGGLYYALLTSQCAHNVYEPDNLLSNLPPTIPFLIKECLQYDASKRITLNKLRKRLNSEKRKLNRKYK